MLKKALKWKRYAVGSALLLSIGAAGIYTAFNINDKTASAKQQQVQETAVAQQEIEPAAEVKAEAAASPTEAEPAVDPALDIIKDRSPVLKESMLLKDVPLLQQLPELARGCEVTSLAMVLQYAGVSADKMTLAKEVAHVPFRNGALHGNPNEGFVGNIYTFSESGYGVYHKPVAALAEKYLPGRIVDATGNTFEQVLQIVSDGAPVWIITNSTFAPLSEASFSTWKTNEGDVRITYREHSVVIVGYDADYIYINDPLNAASPVRKKREAFEKAWVQMGSQAISYTM